MNSNAPRFGVQFPGSTPAEVGPYTYMLDDTFQLKRRNVVPFCSTDERKTGAGSRIFSDALYNLRELRQDVSGGHSLRNRAKRFVYRIEKYPGPGTYDPKLQEKRKKPPNVPVPGKGRLYFCKVEYSVLGHSPSIPTHIDENGYEIGANGNLIKNPPDPKNDSVGPATYCIRTKNCVTSNLYQGNKWSRRTSKRDTYRVKPGPGPGTYQIQESKCVRDTDSDEYREMAKLFSFLPRFVEDFQLKTMRENLPAPNLYNINDSCFHCKDVTSILPKPFISRKPRFVTTKFELRPGPAAYTLKSEFPRKSVSKAGYPFVVQSQRFPSRVIHRSPGPLAPYFIKGQIEKRLEKRYNPHALYVAPFQSTVERDINFVRPDEKCKPSCAEYPVEDPCAVPPVPLNNSVFLSRTQRFKHDVPVGPESSKYSVTEPFNKNRNKKSHNKKLLPFNATDIRRTVEYRNIGNPGPAHYLGKKGINGKGYFFDRTERFPVEYMEQPAPNTYNIHPAYRESTYNARMTYNLPVTEQVLKKRLRLAPKDTFKDWVQLLLQKKKLRCFEPSG